MFSKDGRNFAPIKLVVHIPPRCIHIIKLKFFGVPQSINSRMQYMTVQFPFNGRRKPLRFIVSELDKKMTSIISLKKYYIIPSCCRFSSVSLT